MMPRNKNCKNGPDIFDYDGEQTIGGDTIGQEQGGKDVVQHVLLGNHASDIISFQQCLIEHQISVNRSPSESSFLNSKYLKIATTPKDAIKHSCLQLELER